MKENIHESMIYGYMLKPINEDIVLEFDIRESIKKIIAKIKEKILKLLDNFESALNNCKDSIIKSIILTIITKLKSLLSKADNINTVEDANKIKQEVEEAVNIEWSSVFDSHIAQNDIQGCRNRLGTVIHIGKAKAISALNYLKSKGVDIFTEEQGNEKCGKTIEFEYDNNLSYDELEDRFIDYMVEFKDGNGNCTYHNFIVLNDIKEALKNYKNK